MPNNKKLLKNCYGHSRNTMQPVCLQILGDSIENTIKY